LILRKIIKIVFTSCQILRLKCIKFDYSAPPDPLAGFQGPTSKGSEGRRRGRGGGREGEGREGKGRGGRRGEGKGLPPYAI